MTTQLVPQLSMNPTGALGLPPPRLDVESDLVDAGRTVGWIDGDRVGFRGFADATEAAHAAWVAWRTLARRLARSHGTRPVPIDRAALALQRQGEREVILADDRPIATLVRPGALGQDGLDTFGFEIRVPAPVDQIRVRSMAYLMYRTLRKSGVRWALWRPAPPPRSQRPTLPAIAPGDSGGPTMRSRFTGAARAARARFSASERPIPAALQRRRVTDMRAEGAPSALVVVAKVIFSAIALVMAAALTLSAPATVTIPLAMVLVAGLAGSSLVLTVERRMRRRPDPRRLEDGTRAPLAAGELAPR